MPMPVVTADVLVIGLGAMGGAAFRSLADRGLNVIGIEQFSIGHALGSSHGESRIIRKAYFEHPDYVPLLHRSYELWRELEIAAGRRLYHETGLLLSGPEEGEAVPGAKLAARLHGLALEELSPADVANRFPWLQLPPGLSAVFEPEAGLLEVENCVEAQVREGERLGGRVVTGERVVDWTSDGSSTRVVTDRGHYEAGAIVICGGAWAGRLLAELHVPLEVVRKPVAWFESRRPGEVPNCGFFIEWQGRAFYGVPSPERRLTKLAEHTGGDPVDPDQVDRELREGDLRPLHEFGALMLKALQPTPVRSSVCLYTLTPDRHFLVDRHPAYANTVFACGFSGHGFKFAPVIGEALADLVTSGHTPLPIGFLKNRWIA